MESIGAEQFRALARSAPWRWSDLDVTVRRSGRVHGDLRVRAQLHRGDASARVVDADSGEVLAEARPAGRSARGTFAVLVPEGTSRRETARIQREARESRDAARPVLDDDGLVAARPHHVEDPPFWQDYHWVATFDPVELADGQDCEDAIGQRSAAPDAGEPLVDESGRPRPRTDLPGTEVGEVRAGAHHGREAWTATLRPTRYYEPRCGCCALLPHPEQARREWGEEQATELGLTGGEAWPSFEATLDVATGVLVRLEGPDGTTDVEIHSAS